MIPRTGSTGLLDAFFKPKSVAVVGATEKAGSAGRIVLWNLISSPFGGTVYPVNSRRASILGIKSYASVSAIPDPVELAVVITPALTVPDVIRECGDKGVKAAVVISAGFRETGPAGEELESRVLAEAHRTGMRIIGPNCLGVMNPRIGFNATFAQSIALPGDIGFLSQSGAMCSAVLDWSLRTKVGFSTFVSTGSMLDVNWGTLIDHLGDDELTRSIVIYMESVGDARNFLSAAREVALRKPIIVIKAGRTAQAAQAAASHTGSLAGSDDVLDAAFRRCGVLRVDSISDVFDMVDVLGRQPLPRGPRLMVVTNAGGPGVIATDALLAAGGELAELSIATMTVLDSTLPPHWSRGNPVDVIGDADAERYSRAIKAVSQEPESDGLLVILTPQGMTDSIGTANRLAEYAHIANRPVLASWMGGAGVGAGVDALNAAGIPAFSFPDTAARAFVRMWDYQQNLEALYETPVAMEEITNAARDIATRVVVQARTSGRTLLTEVESKEVLGAYGIPVVPSIVAGNPEEAVRLASGIGYPVVLKLNSQTITHKTEVGGVRLNLTDAVAVREAFHAIERSVTKEAGREHFGGVSVQPMIASDGYELIFGSSVDSQFGPVLLFGSGGQLVEIFKDRVLGLPPLNTTLALRMMERTRIFAAFRGVRGRKPIDVKAIANLLVRFSQLVVDHPAIREMDINPLHASPDRTLALDARIVLFGLDTSDADLPKLAIRPYPAELTGDWKLHNGQVSTIRPIRPEDEPALVAFHGTLSENSVYLRYFEWLRLDQRTGHERLARMCFIDYDRQMALVGLLGGLIVGIGRLTKLANLTEGEVAFIVSDAFQNLGLGSEILRRLIDFARAERAFVVARPRANHEPGDAEDPDESQGFGGETALQ